MKVKMKRKNSDSFCVKIVEDIIKQGEIALEDELDLRLTGREIELMVKGLKYATKEWWKE